MTHSLQPAFSGRSAEAVEQASRLLAFLLLRLLRGQQKLDTMNGDSRAQAVPYAASSQRLEKFDQGGPLVRGHLDQQVELIELCKGARFTLKEDKPKAQPYQEFLVFEKRPPEKK